MPKAKQAIIPKEGPSKRKISLAKKKCKEAFKGFKVGDWAWNVHHTILLERLSCSPITRVNYILVNKPDFQQEARFNSFRPVKSARLIKLLNGLSCSTYSFQHLPPRSRKFAMNVHKREVPLSSWREWVGYGCLIY